MTLTAAAIRQACVDHTGLANPLRSPGCSPALRALAAMAGLNVHVARELAHDGDPHSHEGGNAIDLVGPGVPQLAAFLRDVPTLFAAALWSPQAMPDDGLYVWGGATTGPEQFSADALAAYSTGLHLSSSWSRLHLALGDATVHARLNYGIQEAA